MLMIGMLGIPELVVIGLFTFLAVFILYKIIRRFL